MVCKNKIKYAKRHAKFREIKFTLIKNKEKINIYCTWYFYFIFFILLYFVKFTLRATISNLWFWYTVQIKKRNLTTLTMRISLDKGINLLSDTLAELIRSLLFIQSAIVQLHTGCVQLVHLYEAYDLYTLNGKWHTHVTKRWSIGWYNLHVTSYVMGDTGIANAHRVRNVCVHKSNR